MINVFFVNTLFKATEVPEELEEPDIFPYLCFTMLYHLVVACCFVQVLLSGAAVLTSACPERMVLIGEIRYCVQDVQEPPEGGLDATLEYC